MITRILPVEEWPRLLPTTLGPTVPVLNPACTTVIVVEDDEDQIIGCWALLTILHAEGVWIAPDHRKRGRVAARLWQAMTDLVEDAGATSVMTGAETPEVASLIEKRGGIRLDKMIHYLLPMTRLKHEVLCPR